MLIFEFILYSLWVLVFWCWCFVGILYDFGICVGMGVGVEVGERASNWGCG